jgi:ABC-type nitrate/sulfonate/bicarbonate transport system substrate-binding protein
MFCVTAAIAMSPAARAELQEVQFGTTGTIDATSIATFIALDKKLFEAEGLKVNWVAAGSASKAVQQTVAGSLDIGVAATDQTIRAISQGAGLKIIVGAVNAAPFRVVGRKDIKGWSDLKGKTISVGGAADQTLFFFRIMARKNGLKDGDYDLVYAGTTPARFAQLMSGAVGAAVLTNPNDILALDSGAVDLGTAPDYVPVWAQNNAFVNTTWAQSHRAATVDFVRAYKKAIDYFYDPANHDEVIRIWVKYSQIDAKIAEQLYTFYRDKKIIAPDGALNEDGIQAVVQSLVDIGDMKASVPAKTLIDTSYMAEAVKK